ncbi:hypothetical protein BT69DRAFT_334248 [Atractiella rhizophila]|nr:hypothetical protein BT69DRAFT_334248 [Atractiella rhizophila]
MASASAPALDLLSLPTELIEHIFELVPTHIDPSHDWGRWKWIQTRYNELRSLCLVSKALLPIAQRLLYQVIHIHVFREFEPEVPPREYVTEIILDISDATSTSEVQASFGDQVLENQEVELSSRHPRQRQLKRTQLEVMMEVFEQKPEFGTYVKSLQIDIDNFVNEKNNIALAKLGFFLPTLKYLYLSTYDTSIMAEAMELLGSFNHIRIMVATRHAETMYSQF